MFNPAFLPRTISCFSKLVEDYCLLAKYIEEVTIGVRGGEEKATLVLRFQRTSVVSVMLL